MEDMKEIIRTYVVNEYVEDDPDLGRDCRQLFDGIAETLPREQIQDLYS